MRSSMRLKRQVAFCQNSGILVCLCVRGLPEGCCSIRVLVSEVSRGKMASFFS